MDTIVINPTNWQALRLAKDSSGQFFGGGPFHGAYGGPAGPATASQFATDSVWGVKVVVTSAITVGTALVGAFATGGAIHRRGGLTVEATNSHGSAILRKTSRPSVPSSARHCASTGHRHSVP